MDIIGSIISYFLELAFEVGLFIGDLLDLRKNSKSRDEMSSVKRLILSLVGGLIICLATCLVFFLIFY